MEYLKHHQLELTANQLFDQSNAADNLNDIEFDDLEEHSIEAATNNNDQVYPTTNTVNNIYSDDLIDSRDCCDRESSEEVVEFVKQLVDLDNYHHHHHHDLEFESEEHFSTNKLRINTAQSILDKSMDQSNFILKEQQQRSINGFDSSSSNIGINIDVITTSSSSSTSSTNGDGSNAIAQTNLILNGDSNLNHNNLNTNNINDNLSTSGSSNLSSPIESLNKISLINNNDNIQVSNTEATNMFDENISDNYASELVANGDKNTNKTHDDLCLKSEDFFKIDDQRFVLQMFILTLFNFFLLC